MSRACCLEQFSSEWVAKWSDICSPVWILDLFFRCCCHVKRWPKLLSHRSPTRMATPIHDSSLLASYFHPSLTFTRADLRTFSPSNQVLFFFKRKYRWVTHCGNLTLKLWAPETHTLFKWAGDWWGAGWWRDGGRIVNVKGSCEEH